MKGLAVKVPVGKAIPDVAVGKVPLEKVPAEKEPPWGLRLLVSLAKMPLVNGVLLFT